MREAGFSLIELLVALSIMALATSMVIFTSAGAERSLAAETDQLIASLVAARDLALVENRTVTVELSEAGYQTTVRSRLAGPRPAAPLVSWQAGTSIATRDDRLPTLLLFDPVGLAEPARLTLFRKGAMQRISIASSGEIRRVSDGG
jgi:general secretion pathway protein H